MGVRDAIAERLGLVDFKSTGPSARDWLFNDRSFSVGSFLWLCSVLNVEVADEIRAFVLRATVEDFRIISHASAGTSLR